LANLYLHWFDALFYGPQGPGRRSDVKLVRYADDFVALAKQMGSETIEFIESRLEGKFQLEIPRGRTGLRQPGKDAGGGPTGTRGKSELSGLHISVRPRPEGSESEIPECVSVEQGGPTGAGEAARND
jgi:hypothetical protein